MKSAHSIILGSNKPTAITNAPIPVVIIAVFRDENAATKFVFITAPKFTNESLAAMIPFIPSDNAIADCTFSNVFCTSSPSTPTKPNAPSNAWKPFSTPPIEVLKALNLASGLNASVNAFASPIASFNSAAFLAAAVASCEVTPNFSDSVCTSACASLNCDLRDAALVFTSNSITFFSAIIFYL